MKLFRADNTEGYTDTELDDLNAEWDSVVDEMQLEVYTEAYNTEADAFSNEVAKR